MNGGMFRRAVFGPFFLADISCEKLSSLDFDLFSGAMLPWLQTRRYALRPGEKTVPGRHRSSSANAGNPRALPAREHQRTGFVRCGASL